MREPSRVTRFGLPQWLPVMCCVVILSSAGGLIAQQCPGVWMPGFGPGGTDAPVEGLVTYDDGSGVAVYAVGEFRAAGEATATSIARFDGTNWNAVGTLPPAEQVNALAVYDEGTGPRLFAAGRFIGATGAFGLARWDGANWSLLARIDRSGFPGATSPPSIQTLKVVTDSAGTALYAAGDFNLVEGTQLPWVLRYSAGVVAPLGNGIQVNNSSLPVFTSIGSYDEGAGPVVFVGGNWDSPGGGPSRLVAWDGSNWALRSNIFTTSIPQAMARYTSGSTDVLLVGTAGSSAGNLYAWDGSNWSVFNGGVSPLFGQTPGVMALEVEPSGVIVGGTFSLAGNLITNGIAQFSGSSWSSFGQGFNGAGDVRAITRGLGGVLVAGGDFSSSASSFVSNVAAFNGSSWVRAGGAGGGTGQDTIGGASLFDGSSPVAVPYALHSTSPQVRRWTGTGWVPASLGLQPSDDIRGLATYVVAPNKNLLFAYGTFQQSFGLSVWNGSFWQPVQGLPAGAVDAVVREVNGVEGLQVLVESPIQALSGVWRVEGITVTQAAPADAVFASITGAALEFYDSGSGAGGSYYVGGASGVLNQSALLRYDGANWLRVDGMQSPTPDDRINDLEIFNGELYLGGALYTQLDRAMVSWDGQEFDLLSNNTLANMGGAGAEIFDLALFSEGYGDRLVAIGDFDTGGGVTLNNVGLFDGAAWSGFDTGLGNMTRGQLVVHNLGGGPELFAVGNFANAGARPVQGLAHWRPSRPVIQLQQTGAAGSGVVLLNSLLNPGFDTFNLVSVTPCNKGIGNGPWFGLCGDPFFLLNQALLPAGAGPFHIIPSQTTYSFGPVSIASGVTLEATCIQIGGANSGCPASVARLVVQ